MQVPERVGLLSQPEFAQSPACADTLGVGQPPDGKLYAREGVLKVGVLGF